MTLWTTQYTDAAVDQLRAEGDEIRDENAAQLSLPRHRNPHVLGCCNFTASTPAGGALRSLRELGVPGLNQDESGEE